MRAWLVGFLVLSVVSQCWCINILYVSEHTMPIDFENWLNNRGFNFDTDFPVTAFAAPISPMTYQVILYQNDGGSNFTPGVYRPILEDYVFNGGVVLYFGRESISANTDLLGFLGIDLYTTQIPGDYVFQSPISSDPLCYPLVNAHRKNLRLIVPSEVYPNWVENRLNDLQEVSIVDPNTVGCIPSSYTPGYYLWTIRRLSGGDTRGMIAFMSTSTYVTEEFWKLGFYQAGFLNLLSSAETGTVFGDPHVVTLARQSFDMPVQSTDKFFNFFATDFVSVNAKIQHLPAIAPGLWITNVGLSFTENGFTHMLHCYFDDQLQFHFMLDGQQLEDPTSTNSWEFVLENTEIVGQWRDSDHFDSPGLFRLHSTEDGSTVTIQAVEWRDAPSFSIHVTDAAGNRERDVDSRGILQHPLVSASRDNASDAPDVFLYQRTGLFD